jgi:signal transduction histidine kinase
MAAWVAGATLSVLIAQGGHLSSLVPALITAMAAWGVGLAMGALRQLASELDRRSAQLRSVRNERAHAAVAMERTRIARELQAVVAHGVAAMVLETEAAERLLDQDVAAADAALEVVEQMGREALGQMRRILGVLRRSDVRAVPTRGVQT